MKTNEVKEKRWIPEQGDNYYFINQDGEVDYMGGFIPEGDPGDLLALLMKNAFKTWEEAETHREEMMDKYKFIYDLGMEGERSER